jgi:hypothetical protein
MAKTPLKTAEHTSFLAHRNYLFLKLSLALMLISIIGYFATDFEPVRNGGTWYGYTLGVIATLLILWLTFLGLRKRWISQGHWSLKGWTSAHVYLGLSLIVVATLHTGFQFGWNLHTLAYGLMIGVIVSGLFGIYYYAVIPQKMSVNREEKTQVAMLDELVNLDRLLHNTAQSLPDQYIRQIQNSIDKTKLGGRMLRRLSGRDKNCPTRAGLQFFRTELRQTSAENHGPILDVISVLERKNALLGKIRTHIRYRTLLELWLYFHIPLTFALLGALTAHIVSVFYYS